MLRKERFCVPASDRRRKKDLLREILEVWLERKRDNHQTRGAGDKLKSKEEENAMPESDNSQEKK